MSRRDWRDTGKAVGHLATRRRPREVQRACSQNSRVFLPGPADIPKGARVLATATLVALLPVWGHGARPGALSVPSPISTLLQMPRVCGRGPASVHAPSASLTWNWPSNGTMMSPE